MAIKNVTPTGFVTRTSSGQSVLEETTWDYEADFGIMIDVADGSAMIDAKRLQFVLWQLRNGVSQRVNDCHVSHKSVKDKTLAVQQKVAQFKRGEMSAEGGGGGPRLSPYEAESRTFVSRWLIARGIASKAAMEHAKDLRAAAKFAAEAILEDPSPDAVERLVAKWHTTIERRVAELGELPGNADESE